MQIETLPTRSNDEQPLQNILSISTAGRNRYLLHFNSHHALVQWTAAIRLAIYEHNTLQEAYTGALIAAKGRTLNNINVVMERARFPTQEWVRVRFGAGVPWRRCWCVISPPDEKEYLKQQKELKKRSPYDRSHVPVLKGDIKFYDNKVEGKKLKKAQPIATITDAYSAYAIYPQAKSLIDASTLLKIEGNVTIHSEPPSSAEGFVFIMPETRPMVTGFEMLLRFLFPTWDTYGLYGRPGKLVASVLDPRSLMFAMPKHKRYGYLELLDVSTLINENGSTTWNEQEWRRRLKESTGTRMNAIDDGTRSPHSRSDSRSSAKVAFGQDLGRPKVGFAEDSPTRGARSQSVTASDRPGAAFDPRRQGTPPVGGPYGHNRNTSDSSMPTSPPQHYGANPYGSPERGQAAHRDMLRDRVGGGERSSSEEERGNVSPPQFGAMRNLNTPEPVSRPPEFGHTNQKRPVSVAYHTPEMRRANSRLSSTTLAQLAKAGGLGAGDNQNAHPGSRGGNMEGGAMPGPSVHSQNANSMGTFANDNRSHEALRPPGQNPSPLHMPPPLAIPSQRSASPAARSPYGPPGPMNFGPDAQRPHTSDGPRPNYPPGGPPRSPLPPNRMPGSPGPGAHPPQGRGRPPPNMRHPPGQGPPPQQDYYGRGQGPPPGASLGPPGPGQHQQLPDRSTSLDKHASVTADHIIEHYATDHGRWQPTHGPDQGRRHEPNNFRDDGAYDDRGQRPRVGVLKTVGGPNEPPPPRAEYDIPDVNFGPTINYGAGPPRNRPPHQGGPPGPPGPGGPGGPYGQRPYSPAPPRPSTAGGGRNSPAPPRPSTAGGGRNSPAPQYNQGMRRHDDPNRSAPWSPTHASPGPGYSHGPGPGPQAGPYGGGRGGPMGGPPGPSGPPGPQGQGASFSRPLQSGAQSPHQVDSRFMPPQGQYSAPGQPPPSQRNVHPQYQGQAF